MAWLFLLGELLEYGATKDVFTNPKDQQRKAISPEGTDEDMGKVRRRRWILAAAILVLAGMISGCHRGQSGLSVVGSTSVEPFAEALAEEFMTRKPGEKIFVQGGGSSAGIQAVRTGAADVGMSARNLDGNGKGLDRLADHL